MNLADLSLPPRIRVAVVLFGVLFHILLLFGLIRAFAPGFTQAVADRIVSVLTVDLSAVEPSPEPTATGEEGASAPEGRLAKPKEVAAPKPEIRIAEKPAAKAASTGTNLDSGARDTGDGTGGGGQGQGAGSGNGGFGQGGGGIAAKPSVRSGELNEARDFPVPEGGRKTRFGKSVTVAFTVTTEGRARGCSVLRSEVDPATTASVCPLVIEKIRFNPATRSDGSPVEARYGYRVDFSER